MDKKILKKMGEIEIINAADRNGCNAVDNTEEDMMGCMLPVAVQEEDRINVIHQKDGSDKKIRALCQRDGTSDYSYW
jgi:hypothetical protein